jgi:glycosyltransferase involved in cell wall biosynthesis
METKIAVLFPIYFGDSLDFLKESLESVLNQTYTSFSIVLLIDGSLKKGILEYLEKIDEKRLIILRFETNRGLSFVLNDGVRYCLERDYEYIARMDADDICFPNRFEKQLKYLQDNLDCDCLGSNAIEFTKDNFFHEKKMPLTHIDCYNFFKKRNCMIHSTVMFRRSYFEKCGLYPVDTYYEEDTMLWANGFFNNCKFANLDEPLLYFRLDDNFFLRRRGWKHAKNILLIKVKIKKMLNYGFDSYLYAISFFLIKMLPSSILRLAYKTLR